MNNPLITGIHANMIGVKDSAALETIFHDALEWDIVAKGLLSQDVCRHLWQVASPADVTVLAPRYVPYGRVHLLRFPKSTPSLIENVGPRTYGFWPINAYVRDMDDVRKRVVKAGGVWGNEVHFEITSLDGTTQKVHQGRAILPDGAGIVFVIPTITRWTATWFKDESAYCTEATSVIVAVPDVDISKAFWGPEGLGLEIRYDTSSSNSELNRMAGLESDAVVRLAFGWGEKTARVEILGRGDDPYTHVPSADLTERQRPGISLGNIGWVVCVEDLDVALPAIERQGGRCVAQPINLDNEIHGQRRVCTVQTPEGTWISIWEGQEVV